MVIRLRTWPSLRADARRRGSRVRTIESLEVRTLLAANPLSPDPQTLFQITGSIEAESEIDSFPFQIDESTGGNLTASVAANTTGFVPRLSLVSDNGLLLVQSDGGLIEQHLGPGRYALQISGSTGLGSYQLLSQFIPADAPLTPLTAGTLPRSIVSADFNCDGRTDLVTANELDGTLGVRLGTGFGTFQPVRTISPVPTPIDVAVADINGDGFPDLVSISNEQRSLSVAIGRGNGEFAVLSANTLGFAPSRLAVGDINGDGLSDVAVANYDNRQVHVLLSRGNGTFQQSAIGATNGRPLGIVISDIDGDGSADVIAANYDGNSATLLPGNGDGTFASPRTIATGNYPTSPAVADIDGDGLRDLVVVNYGENTISVLYGTTTGGLERREVFAAGIGAYQLRIADLNGDGRPDIATSSFTENKVYTQLGTPTGSLTGTFEVATGRGTGSITIDDINGDGFPDIVSTDFTDNALSVLLGRGDGTLISRPDPSPAGEGRIYSLATADMDGDGVADLIFNSYIDNEIGILLTNNDGTFQPAVTFDAAAPGSSANAGDVTVADINGDGIQDVLFARYSDYSVGIMLGNGDGTLRPASDVYSAVANYYELAVGDIDGDGLADIISAGVDGNLSVLLNNTRSPDQPRFRSPRFLSIGTSATHVVIGDVTEDGLPDLIIANDDVTLLRGHGDGKFSRRETVDSGRGAFRVAINDIDGDGIPDIISTTSTRNSVTVLHGEGGGVFSSGNEFPAGDFPGPTLVDDFTGDGIADIVTAGRRSSSASLLTGRGDGTFQPALEIVPGSDNAGLVTADFNGDGLLDLAEANFRNDSITIASGRGNGRFDRPNVITLRRPRYSVAVADVNGDGLLDAIRSDRRQNSLTVLTGTTSGQFVESGQLAVGRQPVAVQAVDLNNDGRIDLAAVNAGDGTVSVLTGNGDGSFNPRTLLQAGAGANALAVGDLDGDEHPDLAVSSGVNRSVRILFGTDDGRFDSGLDVSLNEQPSALVIADANGDGLPDIVTTSQQNNSVTILTGRGNRSFLAQQALTTGRQPVDLQVEDLNEDGIADIITAALIDDSLNVLFGLGAGAFAPSVSLPTGSQPRSVQVFDGNGDGHLDLFTANFADNSVSVLTGHGDGTFQQQPAVVSNRLPVKIVSGDVNRDGRPDLVSIGDQNNRPGILIGNGTSSFQLSSRESDVSLRNTPLRVDLDRDGVPDSVVLDRSGRILFRRRIGDMSGPLAAPITLNPDRPARDIAVVMTDSSPAIAAADSQFDSTLSQNGFVFTVSTYAIDTDGVVQRATAFTTGTAPARLLAVDLTGDRRDELVTTHPLDGTINVAIQQPAGGFSEPMIRPAGSAPGSIDTTDANRDGLLDVLVGNQASGDVTVLLNDANHAFDAAFRFRAATLPYAGGQTVSDRTPTTVTSTAVTSVADSVSLTAGDFTSDGIDDVIVVNRGAHSFSVLVGNGHGGFENPDLALTTSTSDELRINERPGAVQTGDFNQDGMLDLVILMEDAGQAWIYTGRGDGRFDHTSDVVVGDQATGVSLARNPDSGFLDLLVGNGFGDVLQLEGRGDGTFQISGRRVSLAVVPDLLGPGQAGLLVGNQAGNRVTVQTSTPDGSRFQTVDTLGDDNTAQLAPGDVQWARLARNSSLPDAIVVSTGGNAVTVYHTIAVTDGVPVFADTPQTLFTGTAPASVTVSDINADAIPDLLVANRSSNDVSIVFGSYGANGEWTGSAGPRLNSGGAGPIAVNVRELTHDGILDLAVTNGASGTVTLLPGVGQGFFDDREVQTVVDLGGAIDQPPTFVRDDGVAFAVRVTGDIVRFNLDQPATSTAVAFDSQPVVAARALSDGQLVVVNATGQVLVMQESNGTNRTLTTVSELQAQAIQPRLPSSLVILQDSTTSFRVIVSSQGSDQVAVFATSVQPSLIPANVPSVSSTSILLTSRILLMVTPAGVFDGSRGLSLSGFTSQSVLTFSVTTSAMLVVVEGDSYSTVAILNFETRMEDVSGDGRERRPELSRMYPVGDASPVMRFVIGLPDATATWRTERTRAREDESETDDTTAIWTIDIFVVPKAGTGFDIRSDQETSSGTAGRGDATESNTGSPASTAAPGTSRPNVPEMPASKRDRRRAPGDTSRRTADTPHRQRPNVSRPTSQPARESTQPQDNETDSERS